MARPIDVEKLNDPSYRAFVLMPIFASGIAKFKGLESTYEEAAEAGMREVILWLIRNVSNNGMPNGEFLAYLTAYASDVADHFGFEPDVVDQVIADNYSKWAVESAATKVSPGGRRLAPPIAAEVASCPRSRPAGPAVKALLAIAQSPATRQLALK